MLSLRRWLVYVGLCCSTLLGLGAIEARQILPPAEKASDKQVAAEKQLAWKDVRDWGIEGRILPEQPRLAWFDRLPASAQGKVTDAVWKLSRDSAGMLVRFRSDSPE
ncbi:MAG: SGNH/GDSL hydrolase N-terminal domain-containing protein, partial [Planctomycetota bacterium]